MLSTGTVHIGAAPHLGSVRDTFPPDTAIIFCLVTLPSEEKGVLRVSLKAMAEQSEEDSLPPDWCHAGRVDIWQRSGDGALIGAFGRGFG